MLVFVYVNVNLRTLVEDQGDAGYLYVIPGMRGIVARDPESMTPGWCGLARAALEKKIPYAVPESHAALFELRQWAVVRSR